MTKIIAQALGIIATLIVVYVVYQKDVRRILIGEIAANFTVALNYFLLNGISGAGICVLATLHSLLSYAASKRGKSFPHWLSAIFIATYTLFALATYRTPIDLIPCLCTVLFSLAIVQRRAQNYRIFKTANSFAWVVYDLGILAFSTVLTHGFLFVSGIIAIINLDIIKVGTE